MRYYPVGLALNGKNVLVVGAGRVAERKIKTLLSFNADIKVVAPSATDYIRKASKRDKIALVLRKYKGSDIKGVSLVIAATSDNDLNRKVSEDAKARGVWVNAVDDTANCDFISTAIIKKKGMVISISTDGKYPKISRDFKKFLKGKLDEFDLNRD